jgi:hypothetical protein
LILGEGAHSRANPGERNRRKESGAKQRARRRL